MPFRFPLEAVLQFRQGIEHQQELRLRAAHQQIARLRRSIERIDHALHQTYDLFAHTLASGVTSAQLRFILQSQAALMNQRITLEGELVRAAQVRDQQTQLFQQARRERETVESLRHQHFQEYRHQAMRKEQRQLDDLFLMRRNYQQRG